MWDAVLQSWSLASGAKACEKMGWMAWRSFRDDRALLQFLGRVEERERRPPVYVGKQVRKHSDRSLTSGELQRQWAVPPASGSLHDRRFACSCRQQRFRRID